MTDLLKLGNKLLKENGLKPNGNLLSKPLSLLIFANRINIGMSQKDIADKALLDVQTIYRIEGGSGGISDEDYAKVLSVLNITSEDIGRFLLSISESDNNKKEV